MAYALSHYVETLFPPRRLPPKAAVSVSAYRRHSFVEGIRNGGLECLSKPPPDKNVNRAHKSSLPGYGFFLSPFTGQERL